MTEEGRRDVDVARRSFAAGMVYGWLLFPESAEVYHAVKAAWWSRLLDRPAAIRTAILEHRDPAPLLDLVNLLKAADLSLEDVDWRMLDERFWGVDTPPS